MVRNSPLMLPLVASGLLSTAAPAQSPIFAAPSAQAPPQAVPATPNTIRNVAPNRVSVPIIVETTSKIPPGSAKVDVELSLMLTSLPPGTPPTAAIAQVCVALARSYRALEAGNLPGYVSVYEKGSHSSQIPDPVEGSVQTYGPDTPDPSHPQIAAPMNAREETLRALQAFLDNQDLNGHDLSKAYFQISGFHLTSAPGQSDLDTAAKMPPEGAQMEVRGIETLRFKVRDLPPSDDPLPLWDDRENICRQVWVLHHGEWHIQRSETFSSESDEHVIPKEPLTKTPSLRR